MNKQKAKFIASIIEILIFLSIAIYLITKYYTKYYIEDLEDNFTKNKDNPIIAFAGGLLGKKSKFNKEGSGFIGFITSKMKVIFSEFLKFLTPVLDIINTIFSSFQDSVNKLRSLLKPIRDFFLSAAEQFYKAIESSMMVSVYSLNKIRNSMRRSLSGFNLIFHTLEHSRNSIQSIIKSPPVKLAINLIEPLDWMKERANCLFCFGPNVKIELINNQYKSMQDINLNDILRDGSEIIAIHKFYNDKPLYQCNNIYVSGYHKINIFNKWISVKDCSLFTLSDYTPEYIYCFSTTSGTITINNLKFKDLAESTNKYVNYTVNSIILSYLNDGPCTGAYDNQYLEQGLDTETYLDTYDGFKKLKNINIGDRLSLKDIVLGKVILNNKFYKFYKYNNIIYSSNSKVYHDNSWKNIENVSTAVLCTPPQSTGHLISTSGFLDTLKSGKILDYLEVHDENVNKKIDEIISII